jgi:hypothetical protein
VIMSLLKKSRFVTVFTLSITLIVYSAAQGQSKFPASEWMKKDTRTKLGIMQAFVEAAKRDGVIMRFSPEYYVKEVDTTIENAIKNHDERSLKTAVGVMIHTIGVMDGDWDNGQDRLEVAKKWLGPENFDGFKEMFPQKYARLLEPRKIESSPWKDLGTSANHRVYHDAESLSYVSRSIVRVWAKMTYVDMKEGFKDLKERGLRKKDVESYDHDLYLYTIDCSEGGFAILAHYSYRKDGTLIDAFDFPDRWTRISPNSVVEGIAKVVCVESDGPKNHGADRKERDRTGTE